MNKRFKIFLTIFIPVIIIAPFIMNKIININPLVISDEKVSIFQAYAGYFGGAFGGLATLITIYFAIIKARKDTKPILYLRNTDTHYYIEKTGTLICFTKKYIDNDGAVYQEYTDLGLLDLHNLGVYPAINTKLNIINLKDFLETAKLLNVNDSNLENIIKSSSPSETTIGLLMKGESYKAIVPPIFELLLNKLMYFISNNLNNDMKFYNNFVVHGKFKLFDIKIDYQDIDNNQYTDIFTLQVRLSNMGSISHLGKFDHWHISLEFDKFQKPNKIKSFLHLNN